MTATSTIPTVTVDQMREVDRLMIDEVGITLLQMMENAGRTLASQAREMLGGELWGRTIVVLTGKGGNGGGGLAAARRLANWGARVSVIHAVPTADLRDAPGQQLVILERIGVEVRPVDATAGSDLERADLIVDALIGYSLRGSPREPIASLINLTNASRKPILALDIPSGLNGDSGEPGNPTIRATQTLTLALPKAGLLQNAARAFVGELFLADISVPEMVYQRLGLKVGPIFERSDVIPIAGE